MPHESLWRALLGRLGPDRAGAGDASAAATLRSLLDCTPAAIVTTARDGSIATWNRAAERLFGWKQDAVIGRPPPYVMPVAEALEASLRQRVLAGNELFHRRGRFRLSDDTEVDMLVSTVPQRDPDGCIVGIISVFEESVPATPTAGLIAETPAPPPVIAEVMAAARVRDTASTWTDPPPAQDRAATQAAATARGDADSRRQSPVTERPSQFLARVSHDLRQPLHALSLLTGALERRVKEPDGRALVADAGAMVRSLQDTFDNIVDFARLEDGAVQPHPVTAPAAEMLQPVIADVARDAQKRGIAFRYVPCRAAIETDPVLLQRILRQLLANALRFGAPPAGKVLLGARRKGGSLRLVVADTGIGMPGDQTGGIFDPFVQLDAGRAAGGLGLGLAIAQRLARLLQTQIGVRSTPGRGSQFWVDVKLAPTR